MITIDFSGTILFEYYGDFHRIKLIQEDGYKIDLVTRIEEALGNYPNQIMQVSYWISDKPCSKDEVKEELLKKLFGNVEACYSKEEYRYSEWTAGTDYETYLKVGRHDLYSELIHEQNKFLIMQLTFTENV
jgi:hypothetical protein